MTSKPPLCLAKTVPKLHSRENFGSTSHTGQFLHQFSEIDQLPPDRLSQSDTAACQFGSDCAFVARVIVSRPSWCATTRKAPTSVGSPQCAGEYSVGGTELLQPGRIFLPKRPLLPAAAPHGNYDEMSNRRVTSHGGRGDWKCRQCKWRRRIRRKCRAGGSSSPQWRVPRRRSPLRGRCPQPW